MPRIYLDHNSTTPIDPTVADAILRSHQQGFGNPASQHQTGQIARRELESIRKKILESLGGCTTGMQADRLVLTSGGTESNNLAMLGLAGENPGRILVSSIEHPSIMGPAEWLGRQGFEIVHLPVGSDGLISVDAIGEELQQPTGLVSVMLANNETGVIQPVLEIARLCHEHDVRIHCDATQAVAKIPVSFGGLELDAMTFSPHKFYGPRGVGGLVLRHGVVPSPNLFGGFQQMGIRPGTEDLALASGMLAAIELADPARYEPIGQLRNQLEAGLIDLGAVINGAGAQRLPHTINASFPGIDRQALLMATDMAGIDLSTGSACASGSSEPSPVLIAMGLPMDVIKGSLRISLGLQNTLEEVNSVIEKMAQIVGKLRL